MESSLQNFNGGTLAAFNTDVTQMQEALTRYIGPKALSEFDLAQIKVPAGGGTTWTLETLEGQIQAPAIDCVVIGWHDRRTYYKAKFGEGDGNKPPDCCSADGRIGAGDPGGECAACALSIFGSGDDNSQACRQYRSLYILRGENLLPEVISVPPTSIKAHRQFHMKLTSFGVPCYSVLTSVGLTRTKSIKGTAYSEVVFNVVRKLTPEERAKAVEYAAMFGALNGSGEVVTARG